MATTTERGSRAQIREIWTQVKACWASFLDAVTMILATALFAVPA